MQVTIDLEKASTPKEIHALLKEKLSFPDYYGCNLDALYDVLLDEHEDWEIDFLHCRRHWENNALYMESLKETFTDAMAEGSRIKVEWYS